MKPIDHIWLDGSIGLSSSFRVRVHRMRLYGQEPSYRSVRYILRIELLGLELQIGIGKGVEA